MINLASGFGDCYANWTLNNNNNMEPANAFRRQLRSGNILALVKPHAGLSSKACPTSM